MTNNKGLPEDGAARNETSARNESGAEADTPAVDPVAKAEEPAAGEAISPGETPEEPDTSSPASDKAKSRSKWAADALARMKAGNGESDAETEADDTTADPLDIAHAEIVKLTDSKLRLAAEMDNLRKRTAREMTDTRKYAVGNFAKDILGVADNIQRAIGSVPEDAEGDNPDFKSFREGVELTERELAGVLERYGVVRDDPKGKVFDPQVHQAMAEFENPDVPAGIIMEVFQPGYLIHDRVLRPAMVVVSKGGAKEAEEDVAAANDDQPNDKAAVEARAEATDEPAASENENPSNPSAGEESPMDELQNTTGAGDAKEQAE